MFRIILKKQLINIKKFKIYPLHIKYSTNKVSDSFNLIYQNAINFLNNKQSIGLENSLIQILTHPNISKEEFKKIDNLFKELNKNNEMKLIISSFNTIINVYSNYDFIYISKIIFSSLINQSKYLECKKILEILDKNTKNYKDIFIYLIIIFEKLNDFDALQKYYNIIQSDNKYLDNNTLSRFLKSLLFFYKSDLAESIINYHIKGDNVLSFEVYGNYLMCLNQIEQYELIINTFKSLQKFQPNVIQPDLLYPLYLASDKLHNFTFFNIIYKELKNQKDFYTPLSYLSSLKCCINLNNKDDIKELITNGIININKIGDSIGLVFTYYCSNNYSDDDITHLFTKIIKSNKTINYNIFSDGIKELNISKRHDLIFKLHELTSKDYNLYFTLSSIILPIYKELKMDKEIDKLYLKYKKAIPNTSAAFAYVYENKKEDIAHKEWKRALPYYNEENLISNDFIKHGLVFLSKIKDTVSLVNLSSRYCEMPNKDPSLIVLAMKLFTLINEESNAEKLWKRYNNNWKGINKQYTLLYNIMNSDKSGLKRWLLEKEMKLIKEDNWPNNKIIE